MSVAQYLANRWRIFADSTTLHGVKHINRAPVLPLKGIWAVIVLASSVVMFYQIFKLTHHYIKEPVTTTVGVRNSPYPVPLFLFVSHTRDLFPPCSTGADPQRKCPFVNDWYKLEGYPVLDYETLTYARSLVDMRVFTSRDFNYKRAKAKFDAILSNYSNMDNLISNGTNKLTYYDLLKPYMTDLSKWIETGGTSERPFRVLQRSVWNIATYYIVEPSEGGNVTAMHHDYQIEAHFRWNNLSISSPWRRPGTWVSFVLTSYGLLTDAIRFEPGRIIKIRFDIQSHSQTPLRRKSCVLGVTKYKMYDEQKCNESCVIKAELKYNPRSCYIHKDFEWGFYDMYKYARPCSSGFHSMTPEGGIENIGGDEKSVHLPGGNSERMREEYERCMREECIQSCELLEVKVESSSRDFNAELGNKSLLYVTWPAVNAVTVYEVSLQYTWDGFVGQLGGLVGLWMGASTMSLFEAFYLCCCCCCDLRKWKGKSSMVIRRGSPNAVSTRMYRNRNSKDEEWKYGGEYQRNGSDYRKCTKDELTMLKTDTWTVDENEKH